MSIVSRATRCCFSNGSAASVRMLCSRSDSFTTSTRRSLAMATSILRMEAACSSSCVLNLRRSSRVTLSTIEATSPPK